MHVHDCFAMQQANDTTQTSISIKILCPLAKSCDGQSLPPSILCDSTKYPYPPQEGSLDSFHGEDGQKSQILNRKYEGRLQRAKKVLSDSLGLVDFTIGLVNSVLNLPNEQVKYFEVLNLQKNCEINSAPQKILGAS